MEKEMLRQNPRERDEGSIIKKAEKEREREKKLREEGGRRRKKSSRNLKIRRGWKEGKRQKQKTIDGNYRQFYREAGNYI